MEKKIKNYFKKNVLVTTDWVSKNLSNPRIRLIESNEDICLYNTGHIPKAVHLNWYKDLQDTLIRDFIGVNEFAAICNKFGISNDTICVFYGDKANWWACYAFWVFKLFGHKNLKIMDGGRDKWINENKKLSLKLESYPYTNYKIPKHRFDHKIRIFYKEILKLIYKKSHYIIDVRSLDEYKGNIINMADYPQEGALRGGHIPGAKHIHWEQAVNKDSTFKSIEELKDIYNIKLLTKNPNDKIIVYCRIGERSSHTWFVLKYLLGIKNVFNYDGSWTEWGNLIKVPIEK